MTQTSSAPTADDTLRFPSLESIRIAHGDLLTALGSSTSGKEAPEALAQVEDFILRGRAAGALLDTDAQRRSAQSLLDYWATRISRPDYEPPDPTLADFDSNLAPFLSEDQCPYLGLNAFSEAKKDKFFGRSQLIADMVEYLRSHRLLAVLGASGSGKSSLVRAGLIPKLKEGAFSTRDSWHYLPPMVPGSNPLLNLARLTRPPEANLDEWAAQEIASYHQSPEHLAALAADRFGGSVVLVVDQFEEVFTLCTDEAIQAAFVGNLIGLINAPGADHRLIVTMRTDYESHLPRLPEFQSLFEKAVVRVTPLGLKELRETIESPAGLVGLKFEEGLVDDLVKDVRGEDAALPLLQFTLLQLWKERERNRVTYAKYRRLGGGRQALGTAADRFYETLIPEDQVTARRILLRLVRPGEGTEVTSSRVLRSSLYHKADAADRVDRVLNKLIEEGLVRFSEGEAEADDQVEVAHEALVRNWPRLVGWLEDERLAMRQRLRLTVAAEQWLRLEKHPSALRRGLLLQESLQFDDLTPLEEEYVKASREAEEAEQRSKEEARQRELDQARALAEEQARAATAARALADEKTRTAARLRRRVIYLAVLSLFAIAMAIFAAYTGNQAFVASNENATLAAAYEEIAVTAQVASTLAVQEAATSAAAEILAEAERDEAERLARRIRAGQLASSAQAALETKPSLSLLLGIEALLVGEPQVPLAEETLRQALTKTGLAAFRGHEYPITVATISESGRWLVTGSEDTTARLWDLTGELPVKVLSGHAGTISAIAISPDEHWIVTSSWDNTVRVWDLTADDPSGSFVTLINRQSYIPTLAFTPDNRWLVTGDLYGLVQLWNLSLGDLTSSPPVNLPGHVGNIDDLAISPDSHWLATASSDFTVRLWDLTADDPAASSVVFTGHEGGVTVVAISPDNHWLVSGGADTTVRAWDLTAPNPAASSIVLRGHSGPISQIAISPDGVGLATAGGYNYATGQPDLDVLLWNLAALTSTPVISLNVGQFSVTGMGFGGGWLAVSDSAGIVRLWDSSYYADTPILLRGDETSIQTLAISPNPEQPWLATGGADKTAHIWNLNDLSASVEPRVLSGHTASISFRSLTLSPNGRWLATGSEDKTARLWDLTAPDPARSSKVLKHSSPVHVVATSSDNRWLATGDDSGIIRLWDLTVQDPSASPLVLRGHTAPIAALAFSPDSRWLVSSSGVILGGGSTDPTVRVWELTSTDPSASSIVLRKHTGSVYALAVSHDGRWLFSGGEDQIGLLWDLRVITASPTTPAQPVFELETHQDAIFSAAFSPDGHWLITGDKSGGLFLWNMVDRDPSTSPVELRGHTAWVNTIAISPDSHWAATGSDDYTARLWDLTAEDPSSGSIVLPGHTDNVNEVAFSADSHWLATASADTTARLWDLTTEDPAFSSVTFSGHFDQVTGIAISSNGAWLATASSDSTARLWTLSAGKLIELACANAGRNLSQIEWDQYISGEQKLEYRQTCPEWPAHPTVVDAIIVEADTQARSGDIDSAIALYMKALELDPSRELDPETRAKQNAAQGVLDRAYLVARDGDVEAAVVLFRQALQLDPTLLIDPESEAKSNAAQGLFDRGYDLAYSGDIEGATVLFQQVLEYNPAFGIEPKAQAEEFAAQGSYDRGYNLATSGDLEGAINLFEQALELDPTNYSFDPETEALRTAAYALRDKAHALALAGDRAQASIVFDQAVQGALLNFDPYLSASVCHYGSVDGFAPVVLPACNHAVEIDPNYMAIYDARALARALTGDILGAIQDFERVVLALQTGALTPFNAEQILAERIVLLEALKAGREPTAIFDQETLDQIREEIASLYALG